MKPIDKAKEIAKKYEQYGCECIPHDCEEAAMQMHEWDKEQFIEWAADWINDNYYEYLQPISYDDQLQNSIDINTFVNDFKKYAEERI